MKLIILIAVVLTTGIAHAQSPYSDSIMRIIGKWEKTGNYLTDAPWDMPKGQQPSAVKIGEKMNPLVRQAYPSPKGMDVHWHISVRGKPASKNAPYPYTVDYYLFWYFYNTGTKKIMPIDETGTHVFIEINDPSFMLYPYSLNGKSQNIEANGQLHMIRELWPEDGTWKGYTLYKEPGRETKNNYARSIILTKKGEPLWLPVSQLQYLQMRRKIEQKALDAVVPDYDKADSSIYAMIAEIQKLKADAALKEKMIARQKEILEDRKKKKEQTIKTSRDLWAGRLGKIDDYIAKTSPDTLQKQAIIQHSGDFLTKGFVQLSDINAVRLVIINPAYFNIKLPGYEPQFIVLRWTANMKYEPVVYFRQQFEANFDVEKLRIMIK